MTLAEILAYVNIIFGVISAGVGMRYYIKCRKRRHAWLKLCYGIMSAYWAGMYIFVAIASPENYNQTFFSQTFIRPAITLTLGLMASGAILRIKDCKTNE